MLAVSNALAIGTAFCAPAAPARTALKAVSVTDLNTRRIAKLQHVGVGRFIQITRCSGTALGPSCQLHNGVAAGVRATPAEAHVSSFYPGDAKPVQAE